MLAEDFIHIYELLGVLNLIRVLRVSHIHAIQVLIQSTNDQVSLANILHESLMALMEELFAPFELFFHDCYEFVGQCLLKLDRLIDFIFIKRLVTANHFQSRPGLIARMKCHPGVFHQQSEQVEIRREMVPSTVRILAHVNRR